MYFYLLTKLIFIIQTQIFIFQTRILVTHGLQWLPSVDCVCVMTNGVISEMGSYEELILRNGAFAQFLKNNLQQDKSSEDDSDPDGKS